MKLDDDSWPRIADLFDQLAPLSGREREAQMNGAALPPAQNALLERLLAAHDQTQPDLLDAQIADIVSKLESPDNETEPPNATAFIGRRFGSWRATAELGVGGMGVVLRGERVDDHFEQQVAIKVLRPGALLPEDIERMRDELRVLATLDHPGIVRLLDGGMDDHDHPYLVMELVDGRPITDYCRENDLPLEHRLRLLLQAARALSYSHRSFILHRDIKPSNVLVSADGHVKLLDFGIASRLVPSDMKTNGRSRKFLRLTPGYAAPEQFSSAPASVAQDVYSFGAVLYEVVGGRRLRGGSEITRALVGRKAPVVRKPLAWLRRTKGVDQDLIAICARAIAEDPDSRYEGIEPLAADIENWLGRRPVSARNVGRMHRLKLLAQRNSLASIMGGLAILALLGGSTVALWQASQARQEAEKARIEQVAAEAALARLRAVQGFMLDLFQAGAPDRPRTELPSTEELLEQGARRVLSAQIEDRGQRLDLLLTLANIYLSHDRYAEAEPLVEAAQEIVETRANEVESARVSLVRAQLARTLGDLESAERWLLEARDQVSDIPQNWMVRAELDIGLSWIWIQMTRYSEAYQLLKPIHSDNARWDDFPFLFRFHVLNNLALIHLQQENPRQALAMRLEIGALLHLHDVPGSLRSIANDGNIALIHYNVGEYTRAAFMSQSVMDRLEGIFDRPHSWRVINLRTLGYAQLQLGQYMQGADNLQLAVKEMSALMNVDKDTIPFGIAEQAWVEQRFNDRHELSMPLLEKALALLQAPSMASRMEYIWTLTFLARGYCLSGEAASGWSMVKKLDDYLDGMEPEDFQQRAELHEARATCYYAEGRYPEALAALDLALANSLPPGRAKERSDCWLLRARIHLAQQQINEAQAALDAATAVYHHLGLDQHPQLARIESLRREWLP